jgi:hypothetical protein
MSSAKPAPSSVWASTASAGPTGIEDPGAVKLNGWESGSACPPFSWMNWILNKCDAIASYLMARGIPDYDAAETYRLGDTIQWTDGFVYRQIHPTNTSFGVAPSNTGYWMPWGNTSRIDAAALATTATSGAAISSATLTTIDGHKTLRAVLGLDPGIVHAVIDLAGAADFSPTFFQCHAISTASYVQSKLTLASHAIVVDVDGLGGGYGTVFVEASAP